MENQITSKAWGTFEGAEVRLWTLRNAAGMEVDFTNYGGRLVRCSVPDRAGNFDDVTLGYDTLESYLADGGTYFGALVGRYGNRIGNGGTFTLDGKTYQLELNNAPNGIPCALHGGLRGISLRLWKEVAEIHTADKVGLVLEIFSPDGEGGYPGNVTIRAELTLDNQNALSIRFKAETDKATPLSLTEHAYWNLDGAFNGDTVMDHDLFVNADCFTPYDAGMIPTGELRPVEGTPFDFRTTHRFGDMADRMDVPEMKYGNGYDHNWVIRRSSPGDELVLGGILTSRKTGRQLEVWTTEPGLQLYAGNFLEDLGFGKNGRHAYKHAGLAIEPQHFPDSPNHPEFPSTIVHPGVPLYSTMVFRFKTV